MKKLVAALSLAIVIGIGILARSIVFYCKSIHVENIAIKLEPRDEYSFYNLGLSFMGLAIQKHDLGILRTAIEYFDKVITINPSDKDALDLKALLTQVLTKYADYGGDN